MLNLKDMKRKKVDLIAKPKDKKGLCSTCKRMNECTYPKNKPIIECDEFEGIEFASIETVKEEKEKSKFNYADPSYKGLCKTCSIREDCTFPKPESGVWHCEEYK